MLVIVDYKAGNLTSVRLAFQTLGIEGTITSDPEVVARADRLVLPGVGAAGSAMDTLRRLGLDQAIRDAVDRGTPLLGICVGMQVLLDFSEEDGGTEMLGFIPGRVVRFQPTDRWDKVPQIGWNSVRWRTEDGKLAIFQGLTSEDDFYFVHSYYPAPEDEKHVLARTRYAGVDFASALRYENILATQFHPEKSGKVGLRLLGDFAKSG